MPPKVSIKTLKIGEAILFTPPNDVENAYVIANIDPVNNIFVGTNAKTKVIYKFKSTDQVVKIDASPLFPSKAIGTILLTLK